MCGGDGGREGAVVSRPLEVGDRVEGGKRGTADYDTGRVVEIDGDRVRVAWDTLTMIWHERSELRRLKAPAR